MCYTCASLRASSLRLPDVSRSSAVSAPVLASVMKVITVICIDCLSCTGLLKFLVHAFLLLTDFNWPSQKKRLLSYIASESEIQN